MKQKWVYPTLLLFVVFYILSNPSSAGPQARDFAGWVGDQAGAFGTFLDGLFDDDEPQQQIAPADPSIQQTNPVLPNGQPATNNPSVNSGNDAFNT